MLTKALVEQPDQPDLLYDIAMVAEKLDKIDVVEARLKQLIALNPENAQALNALGYTLVDRTTRTAEGAALIERAHKLVAEGPVHPRQHGLGAIPDWASSTTPRTICGARSSSGRDAEIAAHLGEVLWAKGERARAREVWQSQLKTTPDNPVLLETMRRLRAVMPLAARDRRVREIAAALVAHRALLACAATPSRPPPVRDAAVDAPFAIDGRLSVRRGTEALAANFTWRHAPPRDELVVSTPLGQTVAEISGDAATRRYELRTADGRREEAADWSTLTERALGVAAARRRTRRVDARRAAHECAAFARDGCEGRVAGCCGRTAGKSSTRTPMPTRDRRSRLQLTQADLEVRIVVLDRR